MPRVEYPYEYARTKTAMKHAHAFEIIWKCVQYAPIPHKSEVSV